MEEAQEKKNGFVDIVLRASRMAERRISGWFVLSAVFLVAVFGLFFTFTERKTWPEQRVELSASDMRIVPPASTLWCEGVALYSDHPFVAYQVNETPDIKPTHLNKQKVKLNFRLNVGRMNNFIRFKYFLLPSSVVEIHACATLPGGKLLVFQGKADETRYIQNLSDSLSPVDSLNSDSSEDSSYEDEEDTTQSDHSSYESLSPKNDKVEDPISLISSTDITVHEEENVLFYCGGSSYVKPMQVNISAADFYTFVLLNTNRHSSNNHFGLRMTFERARYSIQRSGHTFDMCSLSTSCTIGLSFASKDRALVMIPEEPNAGRTTFVIRSQCRPRLAIFAVLSVFFPLLIFLVVAFVVRADKERILRVYRGRSPPHLPADASDCGGGNNRFTALLLEVDRSSSSDCGGVTQSAVVAQVPDDDELPPPYHTLYDPPPPYALVKDDVGK